jgi:hypothetical protein
MNTAVVCGVSLGVLAGTTAAAWRQGFRPTPNHDKHLTTCLLLFHTASSTVYCTCHELELSVV